MSRRARPTFGFWQIWRWPIVLAALTMFGLLSALLVQHDSWHWVSWTALGIPLVAIVFYGARGVARTPQTRAPVRHNGQGTESGPGAERTEKDPR